MTRPLSVALPVAAAFAMAGCATAVPPVEVTRFHTNAVAGWAPGTRYAIATAPLDAPAAEGAGAWSQVALEQPLTCATGLCQGCVVPVTGEGGHRRLVRACVDGPVIRGDRVVWSEIVGAVAR